MDPIIYCKVYYYNLILIFIDPSLYHQAQFFHTYANQMKILYLAYHKRRND